MHTSEIGMEKIVGKKIIDQKTLLSRREEKSKLFIFHNFLSLSGCAGGSALESLERPVSTACNAQIRENEGRSASIYLKRKKKFLS